MTHHFQGQKVKGHRGWGHNVASSRTNLRFMRRIKIDLQVTSIWFCVLTWQWN